MLNRVNREKIKKLKELDIKQKETLKYYNDHYKTKECKKIKYSKSIKEALKDLILSTNSVQALNNINDNKADILISIPNQLTDAYLEKTYIDIIKVAKEKINNKEDNYIFETTFGENRSIFNMLSYVKEIKSNIYEEDLDCLLDYIKHNGNKEIVKTALILLEIQNRIKDKEIIKNIVNTMKNSYKNINIMHSTYLLLKYVKYCHINNSLNKQIDICLDYINKKVVDEEYFKCLNILIENLFGHSSDEVRIKVGKKRFIELLDIISNNYKNCNIDIILKLTENILFLKLENTDIFNCMVNTVLNLDANNDELKRTTLKVINDIVIPNNNDAVAKYYLEKIEGIKDSKKLKMLLSIYPFIREYCEANDTYIFNQLSTIETSEDITLNDDVKYKKLVLPIKYEEE